MTEVLDRSAISHAAQKMRDGAVEMKSAVVEQGSDVLERACEQTESAIKAYPYRSVLIAFGVGALVGTFLMRR